MTGVQVVESYVEAWRRRDPEAIAGHFADDGVRRWEFVVPPLLDEPNARRGPGEIEKPVRSLLTALPDLTLDVLASAETEDGGMVEWRHAGTHRGAWDRWTPQGESVEFAGVSIYRVAGERLLEERIYFDPDQLIRNWVPGLGTLARLGLLMWKQGRDTKRSRAGR